jgi:hypothetical protein
MFTPLKKIEHTKAIKIKSIKHNLNRFYGYSLHLGIVIVLGCILKLIYTFDPNYFGKSSFVTGIPYLRDYILALPLILNISLFIWLLSLFTNNEINKEMNRSITKYLYKNRACFIVTNLVLLLFFYIIYFQLYIPLWYEHQFKLSGHVLAILFSGSMLCNLIDFCEAYKLFNIKTKLMSGLVNVCKFLAYHNLYVAVWSVWVYHEAREAIISYILSLVYTLLLNYVSLDRLVISIFYDKKQYCAAKEKDIVYSYRRDWK